ncbi:hypothetical protein [Devosia submarina]|uniref:hypothetical protein n=1 Tax=Devosia submarina TaxID=1173082 RepID=UPI000D3598FD|nr:hypothetical protein [Devosia submarina]
MTQPNKDNPSKPSADAMTPEQISKATQQNQDRNRPDQDQSAQEGQKSVANDSGTPGYGAEESKSQPRQNGLDNQNARVDDLGDST